MNSATYNILKEKFCGKVCTIFTKPINRDFEEAFWREHFAVRVENITADGVFAIHPYNKTSSFFRMEQIVFIQEEIELDPTNPEHIKIIKEYEKQTGKEVVSDVSPHLTPKIPEVQDQQPQSEILIDLELLENLKNQGKALYDKN